MKPSTHHKQKDSPCLNSRFPAILSGRCLSHLGPLSLGFSLTTSADTGTSHASTTTVATFEILETHKAYPQEKTTPQDIPPWYDDLENKL